jgi:chromosome segregation ATPase
VSEHEGELSERVDALAAWIKELEAQLRANTAVADTKSLKELGKALEAWNKHDPKLEKRLTERVDVLADRFATLAATVNTSAASLAGKDGEIAGLRRALEEGNARIESVVGDLRQLGTGSDVAELRRAVAELSSGRRSHSADPRMDNVASDLDVLAQRLDTLSKTVSTTAAGLAGREGELITLRARVDETEARAGSVVDELRRSLDDVARQVDGLGERSGDTRAVERFEGYVGDLARQIQDLVGSVDVVSASVAEAAENIAANESEVASLGERFDEAGERLETMIVELQQVVATLPTTGAVDSEVEGRIAELGDRIETLTVYVSELETSHQAQLAADRHESASAAAAVAELGLRFDEASQRVDTMILELQQAVAALPPNGVVDAELEARLHELGGKFDGMTEQISEIEASMTAQWRESASSAASLDHLIAEISSKLASVERDRDATLEKVDRSTGAWMDERARVRNQLAELAAAVDSSRVDESLGARLHELASRVEAMEHGQAAVDVEIARVATAWDDERQQLRSELEALATTVGSLPKISELPPSEPGVEAELLREVSRRLDSMEHERALVAAEVARSQELWSAEIGALGAKLDDVAEASPVAVPTPDRETAERLEELALRLEAMERHAASSTATPGGVPTEPAVTEELHDLRVLMNGLRMRLTSSEKELATLASQGDVVSRLDDISLRLASLERSTSTFASAPMSRPGDGRFRVELRGLEQKMEQLESSARENRDAVLMQFERLASRLQWRLQQLELESVDAGHSTKATPAPLGQVVPLRGEG